MYGVSSDINALAIGIGPRDTAETQSQAADYIADQLMGFGYEVIRDPVIPIDPFIDPSENIIARLPGQLNPDKTFIIGAHFDTCVPEFFCDFDGSPGADDNASGVAGMLEIARVLKDVKPDFSIEFVGFALEEVGLLGSMKHAELAKAQGRDLIGMIALEMIGYVSNEEFSQVPFFNEPGCVAVSEENRTVGDFIASIGNQNSSSLLNTFQQATAQYVPDLSVLTGQVQDDGFCSEQAFASRRSDHAPFWDRGYQALILTDTAEFRNPNYHTSNDLPNTINFEFAQQVTQATLATAIVATTSTSVPEPSTLLLLGGAGAVFLGGELRKLIRK